MMEAFNKISEQEENFYKGRSFTLTFPQERNPFVNKGFIKEFNDNGIVIQWTTIDPFGFCVGEITYPNVRSSIEELTFE